MRKEERERERKDVHEGVYGRALGGDEREAGEIRGYIQPPRRRAEEG